MAKTTDQILWNIFVLQEVPDIERLLKPLLQKSLHEKVYIPAN